MKTYMQRNKYNQRKGGYKFQSSGQWKKLEGCYLREAKGGNTAK